MHAHKTMKEGAETQTHSITITKNELETYTKYRDIGHTFTINDYKYQYRCKV